MICEICHQEIAPEAFEKGEALRAKGQPVCAPCARRLGIQADPVGLPRPRSATEALPPPPAAAGPSGGALGPLALLVALAAAGGAGWMLWQGRQWRQDLESLGSRVKAPSGPSAGDVRREMLAQMQELEARLKAADSALSALKDEQGSGIRQLKDLSQSLREEARKAREDSTEAKAVSERAVQDLSKEIQAIERAMSERVSRPDPATPGTETVPETGLAEQYWDNAQARAQALAREGRFLAASREYDRIPKKQRKGDLERKASDAKGALERQATSRVEEALKSADQAAADGKYEYAEGLLAQMEEDCGFPSLLPRIQPRVDEIREQRKRMARKEAESDSRERTRLLRSLVEDLAQRDPEAQRRAVEALKAVGPEAVKPMIQALEHPDARVRWGAVMVLGALGSPDAVVPMAGRLKDKDVQVRLAAADLLAEFNDPRAVPPLIEALADPDEGVGKQAANTLERITHYAPPTVAKPADAVPAWRAWWESGRNKATQP